MTAVIGSTEFEALERALAAPGGRAKWTADPVGMITASGVAVDPAHRTEVEAALRAIPLPAEHGQGLVGSGSFVCFTCKAAYSAAITLPIAGVVAVIAGVVAASGGAAAPEAPIALEAAATVELEAIASATSISMSTLAKWFLVAYVTAGVTGIPGYIVDKICEDKGSCP
jgi:hypothetical protein